MTIAQALHYRIHQQRRFLVGRALLKEYYALPKLKAEELRPGVEYWGRDYYEDNKIGKQYTFVRMSPSGAKIVVEVHGSRVDMHRSVYSRKEFRIIPPEMMTVINCDPKQYAALVVALRNLGHKLSPIVIRENLAALYPDCAEFSGQRLDYLACLDAVSRTKEIERARKENERDLQILAFLEAHPEIGKPLDTDKPI